MPGRGYEHESDAETFPHESPLMRPEFVLSEEPSTQPPLQRHHRRSCTSDCSSSRHASPSRKPPACLHTQPTSEDKNHAGASYTKAADLPDDVREQVRSLLADQDDPVQTTANGVRSMRPLIGEPTRLSAQPTVEEIQMCFAQIDLAILMEMKPTPARRRFAANPHHENSRKASTLPARSSPARPHAPASANCDHVPEYGHRICARRAFGSPPRLLIPPWNEGPTSESDTSSLDIPPDVMTQVHRASAPVSPELDTTNHLVNEAANPSISRMQQLLIERANMRRKSAAAAAKKNPSNPQPVVSRSSRASSPAAMVTLPVSPSSMQQQLIQRANMRHSLQASVTAIEDIPLYDHAAAAKKSKEKGQDPARTAFASPKRNSSADKRRSSSSPEQYHEAVQMTLSSVREDFLQKLQQIQELAAGGTASPCTSKYEIEEGEGGDESSTSEKETKRAYQNPIWTHRSCSSSSLNGGRYRTQEEDTLCLDTDVESQ